MAGTPVTQTIPFDPAGGSLSVVMLAVPASPGHYSLMLLERDRSTLVKDWGNLAFSTPAENTHELPGGASVQDGRLLLAQTSIGVVDPSGACAPVMTVMQDGRTLGSLTDSAAASGDTKESQLVATLSGQGIAQ